MRGHLIEINAQLKSDLLNPADYNQAKRCRISGGLMASLQSRTEHPLATSDDIRAILGNIDADKVLNIVALRPTVADVEAASSWLSGDTDIYNAEPLKGAAAEIVTILSEGEDENNHGR